MSSVKEKKVVDFAPWPYFEQDEIDAAVRVLQSGKVNYRTGNEGSLFEEEFAAYIGRKHAIALANGTLALELALYALDIGSGDEVITTPRTFVASASAVVMRGATPVLADIDSESGNITAETIARVLSPRTKAIIPVHLAGWPCDMDPIMELAASLGIKVIEDCAQAHGATYKGRMVGSIGDMAAFSFCQDKIMTTAGEGGMLLLNDTALYEKAWGFKDHGKSYEAVYRREHPPGFRWLHESFGTNWRLSEVQSAVGRRQLSKLPDWVAARRRNASILSERFASIPGLRVTVPSADLEHAYYKYYVYVQPDMLKPEWQRNRIVDAIHDAGVFCQEGSCSEIYLEKAFTAANLGPVERLPVARHIGDTAMMFLVHHSLSSDNMHYTADVVETVMRQACQ